MCAHIDECALDRFIHPGKGGSDLNGRSRGTRNATRIAKTPSWLWLMWPRLSSARNPGFDVSLVSVRWCWWCEGKPEKEVIKIQSLPIHCTPVAVAAAAFSRMINCRTVRMGLAEEARLKGIDLSVGVCCVDGWLVRCHDYIQLIRFNIGRCNQETGNNSMFCNKLSQLWLELFKRKLGWLFWFF